MPLSSPILSSLTILSYLPVSPPLSDGTLISFSFYLMIYFPSLYPRIPPEVQHADLPMNSIFLNSSFRIIPRSILALM